MEIDWRERQKLSYAQDSRLALDRFLGGDRSHAFLLRALELLRTYTEVLGVGTTQQPADEPMVQLAQAINAHVDNRGFGSQIDQLWPRLCVIAKSLPKPTLYVELMKQLAISKGRQGDGRGALAIYAELLHLPTFAQLPAYLRADLLIQAGTTQLWHGQPVQAKATLCQCLAIEEEANAEEPSNTPVDQFGVRASATPTPLWEAKVYALNQLGNLEMFQGNFAVAAAHFDRCQAVFTEQGEAENLACVAYQSIGRLLLYTNHPRAAIPIIERGLAIRQQRQEREGIAINSVYLAAARLALGQCAVAETLLGQAFSIYQVLESPRDLALCHLYWGQLAALHHKWIDTISHWRRTLTLVPTATLHFIELRLWLLYLPKLLCIGEWDLARSIIRQLWGCAQMDQLTLGSVWRLVRLGPSIEAIRL